MNPSILLLAQAQAFHFSSNSSIQSEPHAPLKCMKWSIFCPILVVFVFIDSLVVNSLLLLSVGMRYDGMLICDRTYHILKTRKTAHVHKMSIMVLDGYNDGHISVTS